jgi:hypothetical protein
VQFLFLVNSKLASFVFYEDTIYEECVIYVTAFVNLSIKIKRNRLL